MREFDMAAIAASDRAYEADVKYGQYSSLHEAYAVLQEEVDEFWDLVKLKQQDRDPDEVIEELLDIAGVAIRAISQIREKREWVAK